MRCKDAVYIVRAIKSSEGERCAAVLPVLAGCLGEGCAELFAAPIAEALERAVEDVDASVIAENDSGDGEDSETSYDSVPLDELSEGVTTTQIEERHGACIALVRYADALGRGFMPFAATASRVAEESTVFRFSAGIRIAGAKLFRALVNVVASAAKAAEPSAHAQCMNSLGSMFCYAFDTFAEAIEDEECWHVLCADLECLRGCFEAAGGIVLAQDKLHGLFATLSKRFSEWLAQAGKGLVKSSAPPHFQHGDGSKKLVHGSGKEFPFLDRWTDLLCAVLPSQHPSSAELSACAVQPLLSLLEGSARPEVHAAALGAVVKLARADPQHAAFFAQQFAGGCARLCDSSVQTVRSAALHAVETLVLLCGKGSCTFASVVLPPLTRAIQRASREEDAARGCAVAALGALLVSCSDALGAAKAGAAALFFGSLPLKSASSESHVAHQMFLALLSRADFHASVDDVRRVVAMLSEFVTTSASQPELDKNARLVLLRLQSFIGEQFCKLCSALPQANQERIKKCLSL